jgi:chemotaxis protein methyltransferase CheR
MAFTYFFRDLQTLDMIIRHVLPSLRTRRYIHVWDAGCAMGPEPYSLAIILRENMGPMTFRNVKIQATDIDESGHFGDIIRRGIYPEEQVKRIPKEIVSKYFMEDGKPRAFKISNEIRKCVSYKRHDLLTLEPVRRDFGLIVCKNVLLHFSEKERVKVITMFHDALESDGFFVTEQTQKMPGQVAGLWRRVVSSAQVFRKVAIAERLRGRIMARPIERHNKPHAN